MKYEQGIRILATGRALPGKVVTNDDLAKIVETSDEWIYERTGIHQRRYCDDRANIEESVTTLAIEAASKAIQKAKAVHPEFDPMEIGVVFTATSTADYLFPSISCLVQKALGLSKETLAYDLTAACSGFMYGLISAHQFLRGGVKYALVIGAEQISKIMDFTDRSTCILFGDGAGAAIVGLESRQENNIGFAAKAWSDGNKEALWCVNRSESQFLKMAGSDIFRFAIKAIPQSVKAVLSESKFEFDEIDYVLCHQANARIIDHVRKKYKAPESKFPMNIEKYANTSSASIPILMDEMIEDGRIVLGQKPAMKAICVGFGAGLTWGGVLVSF